MITKRDLDGLFGPGAQTATPADPPRTAGSAAPEPGPAVFWPCDLRDRVPPAVVRYFAGSLLPGAPMVPAVRLRMRGWLRLGPLWLPLRAEEELAPRQGFRWTATVGGLIRGADTGGAGAGRMRWSLAGLVPLVDVEGYDVARSAAGRCGAEAIWAPAAVLPAPEVVWTADDDRHLRVRFAVGDTPVDLHLHLDESGHLRAFRTMRWGATPTALSAAGARIRSAVGCPRSGASAPRSSPREERWAGTPTGPTPADGSSCGSVLPPWRPRRPGPDATSPPAGARGRAQDGPPVSARRPGPCPSYRTGISTRSVGVRGAGRGMRTVSTPSA